MPRSRENLRPGQQLYRAIEFCVDPETLWGKIESGKWDWLGVRERKGKKFYAVGSLPTSRVRMMAGGTVTEKDADGRYQVVIATPDFHGKSRRIVKSRPDAEGEFAQTIARLRDETEGSSGLLPRESLPGRTVGAAGAGCTRDHQRALRVSSNDGP